VVPLSTEPLAQPLSEILDKTITHFSIVVGTEVTNAAADMKPGEIILLENLRFYPGEQGNDPNFAQNLAKLADFYINDSFANCHRKHASIVGIPKFLPSAAGIRLSQEVEKLSNIISSQHKPVVFVIGGAKSETKLDYISEFAKIADYVLVGGKFPAETQNLTFPENVIVADLEGHGFDISLDSANNFAEKIQSAKTVFWNGPMGVFEQKEYSQGTKIIADAISKCGGETVIGGGDTIAAAKAFGILDQVSWVSSGGGAMLEFLAGKKLPGLEALG
jgi:phosphoglycerate kinase